MHKKLVKVSLVIIAVALVCIFLPPIVGTLTLGISWSKTERTAEREIQKYIESMNTDFLIRQSLHLMEEAKKEKILSGDPNKTYSISAESLPHEWKERKVNFIYYTEEYVDYVWTGGVLGRRALMVRNGDSGIIIEAVQPDGPSIRLFPE